MIILVLNCGSSSIKYQVINMETKEVLNKGLVEKIGLKDSFLNHKHANGEKITVTKELADHSDGIAEMLNLLTNDKYGCIKSLDEIDAVGHRVVHGGEKFCESTLITDEVIKEVEDCSSLAPLHNPQNLKGIYAIKKLMPNVKQVAAFDTAFHQTMPQNSYMYAIPYEYYQNQKIRRYGFHGLSHMYIAKRAADVLGLDYKNSKIITCHLGNGASIAAIKNGESVDTSMGLTPVEGVMMGTRCGDLDCGALLHIMKTDNLDLAGINTVINKKSGVLGVSGVSSDMRDVEDAAFKENNERAKLSLEMYNYKVRRYIGAYTAVLNGVDAIVFAGGIGENAAELREDICKGFDYLGLEFDSEANDGLRGKEKVISKPDSKVKVIVIPTDEEMVIAKDTQKIVSEL